MVRSSHIPPRVADRYSDHYTGLDYKTVWLTSFGKSAVVNNPTNGNLNPGLTVNGHCVYKTMDNQARKSNGFPRVW